MACLSVEPPTASANTPVVDVVTVSACVCFAPRIAIHMMALAALWKTITPAAWGGGGLRLASVTVAMFLRQALNFGTCVARLANCDTCDCVQGLYSAQSLAHSGCTRMSTDPEERQACDARHSREDLNRHAPRLISLVTIRP